MKQEEIDNAVEAQIELLWAFGMASRTGHDTARGIVEKYGVSPENLRSLLESQPKMWDAETIKDAPDTGKEKSYRVLGADGEWSGLQSKKEAVYLLTVDVLQGWYREAFGPLPQPPTRSKDEQR